MNELFGIPFEMKHGEDYETMFFDDVENPIRESAEKHSPDLFMDAGGSQRKPFQRGQASIRGPYEINAQSRALFFVPEVGVREIPFGFRPKDNLHAQMRRRIRFLTSGQAEPAEGFFRKAISRRSNSSFCDEVRLMAFGKAAMLSHKSSTRRSLSEMFSFRTSAKDTSLFMASKYHFE